MILKKEKEWWHYLWVKKLSTLLIHSFRAENKLNSHKKVCKNKYICGTVMQQNRIKYENPINK